MFIGWCSPVFIQYLHPNRKFFCAVRLLCSRNMAMFSNQRTTTSNSGYIVEFKAGRSNLELGSSETKRKVVAEKKKGLVYIKQSNDLLIHFCWMNRENQALEDDLIIFPGDTEFKEVPGCPDGKVYMLKFKSSKEMRLYWLQDGNSEIEKDLVQKVNDALNKPPPSRPTGRGDRLSAGSGSAATAGFPSNLMNATSEEYNNGLNTFDPQHLISLIQSLQGAGNDVLPTIPPSTSNQDGSGAVASSADSDVLSTPSHPASSAAAPGAPQKANASLTKHDLSKILSNLRPATSGKGVNISLSDALSNEGVMETVRANAEILKPLLPSTCNDPQKELEETVRAPQFRQAADTFGQALQSGQIGPVLTQFGLNSETVAGASDGDIRTFSRELTLSQGGEVPPETEDNADETAKEPEPKRNRPDLDDMDTNFYGDLRTTRNLHALGRPTSELMIWGDSPRRVPMVCQCILDAAGYAALVAVAYKLLTVVFNIIGPYVLFSPIDLKKKAGANWAVVTGATDGIGKAYAFELARRGFNVYLVSRTQSKLEETKKEVLSKFKDVEIRTLAFDFNEPSPSAYEKLLKQLNEVEVGVLVNNVGFSYEYPEVLHKVEGGIERLANITTINTLPPTLLSAGILPQMVGRKTGVIINVGSSAGHNQMALWAVYSATKKYVSWLSAILRKEYASQGIIIQTIAPMMVATKMSKVKRTSFFTPNSDNFAKSALNTVGNADDTTGFLTHQLQLELVQLVPQFIRDMFLTKMSYGTRAAALRKKEREAKAQ
ncbi:unnamed protein product [Caenorhabditis auriculariae]|uniref:Proteasomal ubiquitin receptor ADRM1 homolog n=1 Tax=Caenorhabditis auriculariae TaxID=2777116 RepID=A0A8S1GQH6_9PELO|nr:unnamed protein product [Caenorhabditis auriculariae]